MRRTHLWITILVALTLLLGGLISGAVTLTGRATFLRGWEDATTATSHLPFRIPRPGVNVELAQYRADELAAQLEDMAAFGVVWVRQTFPWAEIEPEPGEYHWERWDTIVQAVQEQGQLQLVAVLNLAPPWARHALATDHPTAPPADNTDFGRFARLLAERYGEYIDYYQVWDEPNLTDAWGGLDPKAADYVALLQAAYTAIHEVDEDATVIAAGLAPTIETGPRNYSDVLFLRAIYENGGAAYFDAAAGKPYGFNTRPDDRRVDENVLNFSRIVLLREEMVRHGDAEKALWATQFGWNALPEDWRGTPSIWGEVTRETQLAYTQEAYARAELEWPWLGGLILRHWQPDAPPDDPQWGFSLIWPGDTPPPFESAVAAGPGRHHPVSPFATYSGEWEFSALGADFGQRDDSEVEFVFDGTDLSLEVRRDNYRAYLYVTVDNGPANALPYDSERRSYLILTADDLEPHVDVVPIARHLTPGTHTVHLRAERGWDQWALAAFRVASPPDTSSYDLSLIVTVVVILTASCTLVIAVRLMPGAPFRQFWKPVWQRLGLAGQFLAGTAASVLLMVGMLLTWQEAIPSILRRDPPGLLLGILTAGLLYFSESILLAVIAAILLFILIYNRLDIGFFLTLLWSPFFLFPLELYRFIFPMVEVCVVLTAGAWILRQLVQWAQTYQRTHGMVLSVTPIRERLLKLNALDWAVVTFVGLALLSVTWATHQAEAWREWRTLILEPALFYLMIRTTIRSSEQVTRLADALVLAATAAALVSLGMYLTGSGIITAEGGTARLAGIYGSPNNVGLFLGRAVPFALTMVLLPTGRYRRLLAALAGTLMLVVVAMSQSMGAILLGIPAGIVLTLWLWNARRALITVMAMAGAGILALIPLSQSPRFARLLDFSGGTSFFRLRLWQSAIQMLQEHPLRGIGLDQFLYAYRGRYILPEAWQEPNLSHPHDILLDFWTRLGLGGVALLGWFQIAFWRASWRVYQSSREAPPPLRAVILGMIGSMADLVAHGLIDNSVFVLDLSYVFALLLALPTLIQTVRAGDEPQNMV